MKAIHRTIYSLGSVNASKKRNWKPEVEKVNDYQFIDYRVNYYLKGIL